MEFLFPVPTLSFNREAHMPRRNISGISWEMERCSILLGGGMYVDTIEGLFESQVCRDIKLTTRQEGQERNPDKCLRVIISEEE